MGTITFCPKIFPCMENGVKVKKVLDDMQARDIPRQSIHNHPRKKCSEEIPARFSTSLKKKSKLCFSRVRAIIITIRAGNA